MSLTTFLRISSIVTLIAASIVQQLIINDQQVIIVRQQTDLLASNKMMAKASATLKSCHCAPIEGCEPPPTTEELSKSSIIHVPSNGQCPAGDTRRKDFFSEADGSKQDACFNPKGEGSVDGAWPGEGFGITIPIPVPEPDRPKSRDGKS